MAASGSPELRVEPREIPDIRRRGEKQRIEAIALHDPLRARRAVLEFIRRKAAVWGFLVRMARELPSD